MAAGPNAVFELPGGLVIDGRRLATAELRPLTGREEEWLASNAQTPSARGVTRLLERCVASIGGEAAHPRLIGDLLVGDRDFLILQLRRLTLGDRVQAVVECPACRSKIDVDFDAAQAPVDARPQEAREYRFDAGGREVRFRLPAGADQEAVLDLPLEEAAEALLDRCLIEGSGLSEEQRAAVIDEMERLAPKVEIELAIACPECSQAFDLPFDTTAYFFREMRVSGKQLLREVHQLAFYYHWTESEILGLVRSRRRAYLEMLSETLDRS
jgi:hypothetical protein